MAATWTARSASSPMRVSKGGRAAVLGCWTRHGQACVPRVREDDTDVFTWEIAAPAVLLSKRARFQGFGGRHRPELATQCRPMDGERTRSSIASRLLGNHVFMAA